VIDQNTAHTSLTKNRIFRYSEQKTAKDTCFTLILADYETKQTVGERNK
jgi:hypothetical protein